MKRYFVSNPEGCLTFKELQRAIGILDKANFRRTVREHDAFLEAIQELSLEETMVGRSKALRRIVSAFPVEEGPWDDEGEWDL